MNVGEMMTTRLVTCGPNETLHDVARKMQSENIGCCPVVDLDRLVGIVTDRDVTVRAVARGLSPSLTRVHEIMTRDVIVGSPSMTAEEACRMMSDNQIRRLPIVENDRLVGMVSLADLAIDLEEDEMIAETLMRISQPAR